MFNTRSRIDDALNMLAIAVLAGFTLWSDFDFASADLRAAAQSTRRELATARTGERVAAASPAAPAAPSTR